MEKPQAGPAGLKTGPKQLSAGPIGMNHPLYWFYVAYIGVMMMLLLSMQHECRQS